jgi:hypothetical protein
VTPLPARHVSDRGPPPSSPLATTPPPPVPRSATTAAVGPVQPYGRPGHTLIMEDFILLFSNMLCHLKYFKTTNETIFKMHDFILEFHSILFCFMGCLCDEIKPIDPNSNFMRFNFLKQCTHISI